MKSSYVPSSALGTTIEPSEMTLGAGVGTGILSRPVVATTVTAAGTTTLTVTSATFQEFTGSTYHLVVMPSVDTLVLGWPVTIHNLSNGLVTVKAGDSSTIIVVGCNQRITISTNSITTNTSASWSVDEFNFVTGNGCYVPTGSSYNIVSGEDSYAAILSTHNSISGKLCYANNSGYNSISGRDCYAANTSYYNSISGYTCYASNSSYNSISGDQCYAANGSNSNTIAGHYCTITSSDYCVAFGRRAVINNTDGVFAFADSEVADFTPTVADSFNIRASGGLRIDKGGFFASIQNVASGAGLLEAVSLTTMTSWFGTSGGSNATTTLADGTAGQRKRILMKEDGGGDVVVTVANATWGGAGTITFTNAYDVIDLEFLNGTWMPVFKSAGITLA